VDRDAMGVGSGHLCCPGLVGDGVADDHHLCAHAAQVPLCCSENTTSSPTLQPDFDHFDGVGVSFVSITRSSLPSAVTWPCLVAVVEDVMRDEVGGQR
jgi:hypothetical protein